MSNLLFLGMPDRGLTSEIPRKGDTGEFREFCYKMFETYLYAAPSMQRENFDTGEW